jgi:hypothetical protein
VIFPVKVTETKITGEKPRVVEKEKSNYWNGSGFG